MKRLSLSVVSILVLSACSLTFAQTPAIDSLKKELGKDSTNARVLLQLSKEIRRQGRADEAEIYAQKALSIGRTTNRYSLLDSALLEMAGIAYAKAELENAVMFLNERISFEIKQGDSLNLAKSYGYLGGYLKDQGKKVEALDYQLKAKQIADRQSDAELKHIVYAILGEYYHLTDYDKALEYRLKALEFAGQIKDPRQSGIRSGEISTNIALNYVMKGDYATAKKYLRNAAMYAANPNLPLGDHLPHIYTTYGYIFALEPNYDSAAFYYLKAIDYRIARGQRSRLPDSYGVLGNVYYEKGDYNKAVKYLLESINLSKEAHALHFQHKWSPVLASSYSEMGKYKEAFEVMNEYYLINDSVMSEQKENAIAALETKYKVKEKEYENEMLKKDNALNQKQKLLLGGAAVLIFMAGLVFYFRAQTNKQKNIVLNQKVDAQNRELATVALLVSKKNQAFSQLKAKLQEIAGGNGSVSAALKTVVKDIDQEMDFDEEWNTFKYHFEKVHPDFFTKLKEISPTLSVTELRLCAYLRANMTTKEIARLTNTTIRGVQQAKYRVNQKFPDHSERNLNDYLAKI